jgi:hypothetical protein
MDGRMVSSRGDSHGPHQLDPDGLVDLDDPVVFTLYSFLTVALSQGVALQDGWMV